MGSDLKVPPLYEANTRHCLKITICYCFQCHFYLLLPQTFADMKTNRNCANTVPFFPFNASIVAATSSESSIAPLRRKTHQAISAELLYHIGFAYR